MTEEKPRILIVNDDTEDSAHLKTDLQVLDCITEVASNAREVSEILQWFLPHLILVDLDWGFGIAKTIRASNLNGSVPILFLVEANEPQTSLREAEASSWQATETLHKPYHSFELISRCKVLLSLKKYKKELELAGQVLQSLALAVEARDPTTGNHCDRLFVRVAAMAELLDLDKRDQDALRKGAILHDIGKVGVPDSILLKQGPLTDAEWLIMRQHVVIGESLCRPLKFLAHVLPIIRHHHERLDGSGYPDGLKEDQIPLVARVFQVCDVFDALTNFRPYKQPYSIDETLEIMAQETGRGWWDKGIFKIFERMIKHETAT